MPTYGKRRALGQHFLRDARVIERIADTVASHATASKCEALLEVGPGKGAITRPLIERFRAVKPLRSMMVAERDRALAAEWRHEFALANQEHGPSKEFRVLEGDFLDQPEGAWLERVPLAVASNLPYSAGTAILTRLARHPDKIPFMVLMFQAEVAHRLRAETGTKQWGSLSVWIQNRWDVRRLCAVPPGAFQPPPDVQSEVVVLTRREVPHVEVSANDESLWETLLRLCFAHRRKMLRSGLPSTPPWRNALELSGVDGTKRAEALNWEEWHRLYLAVRAAQGGSTK